jgi:hypothetical protein
MRMEQEFSNRRMEGDSLDRRSFAAEEDGSWLNSHQGEGSSTGVSYSRFFSRYWKGLNRKV